MWGLDEVEKFLKMTEEEYSLPSALTYGFIDSNGKWNQKGEMGWWGMDDKSKATDCYNGEWWQFVETLPEDIYVYIVDCHI